MTEATELDEAAARARCDAATEGPWEVDEFGWGVVAPERRVCSAARNADAEFIAATRTDLPAALDEVERLRAALDEAEASNDRYEAENQTFLRDVMDEQERREAAEAEVERVKMQHDECHHAFTIARDGLTAAESALAAVRALDRGHTDVMCTFPDDACRCAIPLFDLRAVVPAPTSPERSEP